MILSIFPESSNVNYYVIQTKPVIQLHQLIFQSCTTSPKSFFTLVTIGLPFSPPISQK